MSAQYHLLESEFGVAGGARETTDTPGFVESRHNCRSHKDKERIMITRLLYLKATLCKLLNHAPY